jgi:alpha-D-ribose 1-methylphosphonate 5-triphosphate synthase subunit PhnH
VIAGLVDPVLDSQRIFRAVLDAMAHPGRVVSVPSPPESPVPLYPATTAVCLTLVDMDTPLWLDPPARTPAVLDGLHFHCGCPVVEDPGRAAFALIVEASTVPTLASFDAGSDEYPDRSTTVLVQVPRITAGAGRTLSGPGIAGDERLTADELPDRFWEELRDNHARFPRGIDVLLVGRDVISALPRTTRVGG